MDPNANLQEQLRLVTRLLEGEPESDMADWGFRLAELVQALDTWITNGGFLPAAWENRS